MVLMTAAAERAQLDAEKRTWEMIQRKNACLVVQNACRKFRSQKNRRLRQEKLMREREVMKEMERHANGMLREEETHKKQVQDFLLASRIAEEERREEEAITKQEELKVEIARNQREEREERIAAAILEQENKTEEERQKVERKKRWERKVSQRAKRYEEYCNACLDKPDTQAERKLAAQLRRKIKPRYVLKIPCP
jgi:hypothetical protein